MSSRIFGIAAIFLALVLSFINGFNVGRQYQMKHEQAMLDKIEQKINLLR